MKSSQRSPEQQTLFSLWLPVILLLVAIAAESTRVAGELQTRHLLIAFVSRTHLTAYFTDVVLTNHELRKIGHFSGYGLLALGTAHLWLNHIQHVTRRTWQHAAVRAIPFGIACAAFVATLDEWHQKYLPGRSSSPLDVLLDTAGAAFFAGIYALIGVLNRRQGALDA